MRTQLALNCAHLADVCTARGDTAALRALIAAGASLDTADHDGWTPLMVRRILCVFEHLNSVLAIAKHKFDSFHLLTGSRGGRTE